MRDTTRRRGYRSLRLASWLSEGQFWKDTLTQTQVVNLINKALNHKEVVARWDTDLFIEVEFGNRGSAAWAQRTGPHKALIYLPPGTRMPLTVLHEVAHLMPPRTREAMHGPGFIAIHLMLTELVYPRGLPYLMAAYHATHTPYDPGRIPEPNNRSTYVPLVSSTPLAETLQHIKALTASGVLTTREREHARASLRRLQRKQTAVPPLQPIPKDIRVPTTVLLDCETAEEIAALVIKELKASLMPPRMLPTKKKPKPKPRGTTRSTTTTKGRAKR